MYCIVHTHERKHTHTRREYVHGGGRTYTKGHARRRRTLHMESSIRVARRGGNTHGEGPRKRGGVDYF